MLASPMQQSGRATVVAVVVVMAYSISRGSSLTRAAGLCGPCASTSAWGRRWCQSIGCTQLDGVSQY